VTSRGFALALFLPAFFALILTTTAPLVYLAWTSARRIELAMPWLSGFAGLGNYVKMGGDPRFWHSLSLTAIYTATTVVLQVALGLSLALLVLRIPRGQAVLRVAAILPIVLAPVVVGLSLFLLYGRQGWFGGWLEDNDVQVLFALPGMVLATVFVSLPFVCREVVPTLREIGEVLSVTESRVSQLHTKAILRLKARLSAARQHVSQD